ncbi:MAG: hypothetical protein IKK33_16630 [Lachnospiraceae bacterium]|nr:hypothetical protein [Lachnospiraceae bacterium]
MIENLLIMLILVVLVIVFRDEISFYYLRILSRFFPELQVEEPATFSAFEKGVLIVLIVAVILLIIGSVLNIILGRKASKRYKEELARFQREQEEKRVVLLKELSLDKTDAETLLKQVQKIEILSEPVAENFYHHRNSTDDRDKWGVYIGRYFLKCNCTVETYRCVKLLRARGIGVKYDTTCIYEKDVEGV